MGRSKMKKTPNKHSMGAMEYGLIGAFVAVAVLGSMQVFDAKAFGGLNMPALNAVSDVEPGDAPFKAD